MIDYANAMINGNIRVNNARKLAAERFLKDLENPKYIINEDNVNFCIYIIENTFCHIKGELRGELLKLEMWQKFIIFNLVGFELKNTSGERRFKEAFIFLPRKNGKTFFASALAWALTLLEKDKYSVLYIVATKLDRALEAFDNIKDNIKLMGEADNFLIRDNNAEHSISRDFLGGGKVKIQALAADSKRADGLNANIIILDEIHAYKSATDYNVYKEAMKAYRNKLLIGITTAGKDMNSFCYNQLCYCRGILDNQYSDEQYFVFICEADNKEDYTNPYQHEIANPSYNLTIHPADILNDAQQAQNNPSSRTDFLNKSLNIYVNTLNTYFDLDEFVESDEQYNWSIDELSKLPIKWFGGADLSVMHDLTATCLYGSYNDIDICITHAFFPRAEAMRKANDDNIPLFGWEQDGHLTIVNDKTLDYNEPVKWFMEMRKKGFKIAHVGFDPKFSEEFVKLMKKKRFKIVPTPQYFQNKARGFRHIERKVKRKEFYYLHSQAYEYCIGNVKAIEDVDGQPKFDKISNTRRIDLFDASVFAAYEFLESKQKTQKTRKWMEDNETNY